MLCRHITWRRVGMFMSASWELGATGLYQFTALLFPPLSQSDGLQLSSWVVSLFRCLVNLSGGKFFSPPLFLTREQRIAYTSSFPLHLNPTTEEHIMAIRFAFTIIEIRSN